MTYPKLCLMHVACFPVSGGNCRNHLSSTTWPDRMWCKQRLVFCYSN